jgi:TPR repeat protein
MAQENSALGEGLYWMAEKLAWGYDDVEPNLSEAFKLFKQAADLGFSDARIRVGELQENGKGTDADPDAALKNYARAAKEGNFFALAFLAKLLSRSSHLEKAEVAWSKFFAALVARPEPTFLSASRGELLHSYIATQLRLGIEPGNLKTLHQYRMEIVGHHQRLLEAVTEERLERLRGVSGWMELNLGPWPL